MPAELQPNHAQVQRILHSKVFRTSEVQRNLLTYLAEKSMAGLADSLKEYTVGLDVFAKPASYDPRQESVVRMHVGRLRQKLAEYYRTEGVDDPVIVDLPKGGFKVTFETRPLAPEPPLAAPPRRHREITLSACLAVAILLLFFMGSRLWKVQAGESSGGTIPSSAAAAWAPELQQLWAPLLASNRRLIVCLSTPLFIRVPGFGFVRQSASNDWSDGPDQKSLSSLQEALHVSGAQPTYAFTGVGTASGAFLLGQFLAQRKQDVLLTRSDMISMPEIAMDNVIFLGPVTGKQMEAIPEDQQLVVEQNGIRNLKPRPGEPAFLSDHPVEGSQELDESHALITQVPGLYGNGQILYFSGNGIPSVMAAVQAFTTPTLARQLVARMKDAHGSLPRSYQVVLRIRSMEDMPVEISYQFHHELSAARQTASAVGP